MFLEDTSPVDAEQWSFNYYERKRPETYRVVMVSTKTILTLCPASVGAPRPRTDAAHADDGDGGGCGLRLIVAPVVPEIAEGDGTDAIADVHTAWNFVRAGDALFKIGDIRVDHMEPVAAAALLVRTPRPVELLLVTKEKALVLQLALLGIVQPPLATKSLKDRNKNKTDKRRKSSVEGAATSPGNRAGTGGRPRSGLGAHIGAWELD